MSYGHYTLEEMQEKRTNAKTEAEKLKWQSAIDEYFFTGQRVPYGTM